jgi:hypothetical protein
MIGNPRYKIGDIVSFSSGEDKTKESVYVVDQYCPYKHEGPILSL